MILSEELEKQGFEASCQESVFREFYSTKKRNSLDSLVENSFILKLLKVTYYLLEITACS